MDNNYKMTDKKMTDNKVKVTYFGNSATVSKNLKKYGKVTSILSEWYSEQEFIPKFSYTLSKEIASCIYDYSNSEYFTEQHTFTDYYNRATNFMVTNFFTGFRNSADYSYYVTHLLDGLNNSIGEMSLAEVSQEVLYSEICELLRAFVAHGKGSAA